MTQFCVVASHLSQGDLFINGPYSSRDVALVAAANLADDQLAALRRDDPETPWDLDAELDGSVVSISVNDDVEYEWSVFVLIPPTGATNA